VDRAEAQRFDSGPMFGRGVALVASQVVARIHGVVLSSISRSRATLAITDAAATETHSRSAETSTRWWTGTSGSETASSSSASGRTESRAAASVLASSVAWRMLIRSISSGPTNAIDQATACSRISTSRRRRSSGLRSLESRRPRGLQSGREDYRGRRYWPGQAAAADFVDPGNVPVAARPEDPLLGEVRIKAGPVPRRYLEPSARGTGRRHSGTPLCRRRRTGGVLGPELRSDGLACRSRLLAVDAALAQRGGLADSLAQEVELGAAGLAVAHDFDLLDARAVHLEGALDADAAGDAADRDGSLDATTAEAHDGAFEDLDALARAFDDSGRNLDRVTRRELGDVGPDLFLGYLFEHVHDRSLLFVKRRGCAHELCGPQPGRGEGTWNRPPARPTAKDSTS
jgi:hypothetical protein